MTGKKFGIVAKMVMGIVAVSIVTYGTSAFCLLVVQPALRDQVSGWIFVGLTLALGIFWTGLLGWLAARWLVRPLIVLTRAANEAAAGDLHVQINHVRSDDEMRELGLSFSRMIDSLRGMISGISDGSKVADANSEQLRASAGEAAQHAERIAGTMDDIAKRVDRQAQGAEAMLTSVERVVQATDDISRQADEAVETTARMAVAIGSNAESIRLSVEGMRKLAASSRDSLRSVRELERWAEEIDTISGLVGELADQTHLLALNASIEAAHAGEHGQGFAVVAGEVKKLAANSANAVHDINRLIGEMREEVRHTASAIADQSSLADREAGNSQEAAAALQAIVGDTGAVSRIVEDVASYVSSQSEVVRSTLQEARQVADIAELIRQNAQDAAASTQEQIAAMQEIAASTETMREQSANLRRQVERFRV
ncbi:methyl-accepting chemotaxis protein [Paenibacillus agaridevorans]|uniref:methyl-accepting chemotaxis protein n=1 Tax=Paenibacillus agaridevorans TaxID=171404 RepID=UPI001BE49C78|nr:methyl-accepting chemotaxis protein [Paenibacillus agaridevorans]